MAELQPAHYSQNACHTAQGDRQVLASFVCEEGVAGVAGGSLLVSPGTGMNVEVAAGGAFVAGDNTSTQGVYHVYNDGATPLPIAASDPTDPRLDLVVARVYDSTYSGSADEWKLEVLTGQPSPSPSPAEVPLNAVPLAVVEVPAGAATVGSIADERRSYALCGLTGLIATATFSTAGSHEFDKTMYPGASSVRVRVIGGGGSGGSCGATGSGESACSAGGGAGAYAESTINYADLTTDIVPVTVGVGAPSPAGGNISGTAGGTSSFGTYVVAGGGGGGSGSSGTSGNSGANGGVAGSASAGQVQARGSSGGLGFVVGGNRTAFGYGGSSALGGSVAAPPSQGSAGATGMFPGGGGSGAHNSANQTATRGGAGASGVVIIDVFA